MGIGRIEVIIDAQTSLSHAIATTRASIQAQAGRTVTISTVTRDSGPRAFSMSDADVIVVVTAGYELRSGALRAIDQAFATDCDADLMFGPDATASVAPQWSPERLRVHDYLGGLLAIRGSLARRLVGMATDRYPYHRWDLALRAAEMARSVVVGEHALATRETPAITLSNPETDRRGRQVLQDHLRRRNIRALAEVTSARGVFRTRRVMGEHPSVSLLVPSSGARYASPDDHLAALEEVLHAVADRLDYHPVEVIVITDDALPSTALRRLRELFEGSADLLPICRTGASSARHAEIAVSLAAGDVLVILGEAVLVEADDGWLETLVAIALDPSVGAACASPADSMPAGASLDPPIQIDTAVVTPACVAIRRAVLTEVGGLPDDPSGTELAARLAVLGLGCVWTPFVRLRAQAFPQEAEAE